MLDFLIAMVYRVEVGTNGLKVLTMN